MKNKKIIYILLLIAGSVSIGYFANQLKTSVGALMFTIGLIVSIYSSIKLNK